ncbi:MAG: bacteriocin [Gemmataceae bacterium]
MNANETLTTRETKQVKPAERELTEKELEQVVGGGLLLPAVQKVR